MRILITVHQFFPNYRAGTELLVLSVAKELIRRNHDVIIFTGHPIKDIYAEEKRFDKYQYAGIDVYRFYHIYTLTTNQNSMVEAGYNNKLAEYYFNKVSMNFHPELVHHFHLNRLGIGIINSLADARIMQFFTPTDFWMICPKAKLTLKNGHFCNGPSNLSGNCVKHFTQDYLNIFFSKIIQIIPDIFFDKIIDLTKKYSSINYPMSHEVKSMSDRIVNIIDALNKLQGIICPNSFTSKLFIKYGVRESIIYEKSFGIDFSKKIKKDKYKNWNKNRPLKIVFIGTLAPHKGCDVLIKAVNLLPDNFATLTIFGNEEEFPDYVKKLHKLTLDKKNISFKESFPNYEIFSVLDNFDVLVVPSIWLENNPLIIYFAQAVKCPVIGSDLPGISALISHNINGILFKAGDYKDLYKKIRCLKKCDLISLSKRSVRPKTLYQYVDDIQYIWNLAISSKSEKDKNIYIKNV